MSATLSLPTQQKWLTRLRSGKPHQIIAGQTPYLHRWFLIPPNRRLNCYLHHFIGSDQPSVLHDHPWWFLSVCLHGGYLEISRNRTRRRRAGTIALRGAHHRHRIELLRDANGAERHCWTLLLTGPHLRQWGFWCSSPAGEPDRFVPWQQFGSSGCGPQLPVPGGQR